MLGSRIAAFAAGEKKYLAKKPCKNGHDPMRWTKSRQCVVCQRENYAKYIAKRPGWLREVNRRSRARRMGISAPTRPDPGVCEQCASAPSLHLDHDHDTGAFRGWLCRKCNTSIGALGDNIAGLERAIAYLKRAQQ